MRNAKVNQVTSAGNYKSSGENFKNGKKLKIITITKSNKFQAMV